MHTHLGALCFPYDVFIHYVQLVGLTKFNDKIDAKCAQSSLNSSTTSCLADFHLEPESVQCDDVNIDGNDAVRAADKEDDTNEQPVVKSKGKSRHGEMPGLLKFTLPLIGSTQKVLAQYVKAICGGVTSH